MKKRKERKKPVLVARRELETEPMDVLGERVALGDEVICRPITFGGDGDRPGRATRGKVVYIHPRGRYHVVEFELSRGRKVRESFWGPWGATKKAALGAGSGK